MKRTASLARWLVRLELLWVALIAPLLLFPRPAFLPLLLLLPGLWLLAWRVTGRFLPRTALDWPILGLLLMTLISLGVTYSLEISLPKITGLLLGVGLYYALVRQAGKEDRVRWLLVAYFSAGLLIAALGLIGTDWLDKFPVLTAATARLPRLVKGLPGAEAGFQPNAIAGTLVLFLPLGAALLLRRGRPAPGRRSGRASSGHRFRRAGVAGWSAFVGGVVLLTQSRGGWLGLTCGLVALLGALYLPRRLWWLGIPGALAVAALGMLLWFQTESLEVSAVFGEDLSGKLVFRLALWSQGWMAARDFSLFGMGYNVFRHVAGVLYPSLILEVGPDVDVAHPHNLWLSVAVDSGIPGLVAYLALWLANGALLVRVGLREQDWRSTAAWGLLAGWVALFVFGLSDVLPLGSKLGTAIWLALALGQALERSTSGRRKFDAGCHSEPKRRVSAPHGRDASLHSA